MKYTKKNKYLKKRTPKTADYKIRNTVFVFTDSNFLNLIGKTKEEIVFILVWIRIIYEFKNAPLLDDNYNLIKEL